MELSRQSPKPTRYTGIALVIAVHLAGIYALSAGLIKPLVTHQEPTILLPPIKEKPPEPQPVVEKYKAPKPSDIYVPKPDVPPPLPWTEETPRVSTTSEPSRTEPTASVGSSTGTGPTIAPPIAKLEPAIRMPGAICSVMPAPEVPAVSWSGEAVLQVLATVRGGRVVGSEMRVTQGVLDAKTKRALTRSVESALSGYQCQGDAKFQQDFAFRLE